MPAEIVGKEAQHEVAAGLEKSVFAAIPAIGGSIAKMLGTINFDNEFCFRTEQINLRLTTIIEGNGQSFIETEAALEFGQ
jgi:uncharacterized integral membrane protein